MSEHDNIRKHPIAIIGGDLRLLHLAILLTQQGYSVTVYGNTTDGYSLTKEDQTIFTSQVHIASSLSSAIQSNDVIVGPIPFSKDGETITAPTCSDKILLSSFLALLTHRPYVFGGAMNTRVTNFLSEHNVPFCDLMEVEAVAIGNAIATAEGTIVEAMKRSDRNLHQSKALIYGFGRCAKILALKLKGLDVSVTIAARSEEALAYANAYGFQTKVLGTDPIDLRPYNYIFNTVPTSILTRDALKTTTPSVTIIDIASAPGGVDFAAAKELGRNASLCLALPGIYAPKTSANILLEAMLPQLQQVEP